MRLFVYGTLRPGGRYWSESLGPFVAAVSPTLVLPGFELFRGPGYPVAAASPLGADAASGVVGEIVTVEAKWAGVVLASLDRIEGHPTLFRRIDVDGMWFYTATDTTLLDLAGTPISSGDWFDIDDAAQRAWSAELGRTYVGPQSLATGPDPR